MKKLKQFLFAVCAMSLMAGCSKNEVDPPGCDGLEEETYLFAQQVNDFSVNPSTGGCYTIKATAIRLLEIANKCSQYVHNNEFKQAFIVWEELDCSGF